jgi:hypothetical protein
MTHLLRHLPAVKIITEIAINRSCMMDDSKAIDDFSICRYSNPLVIGVLQAFIVKHMDESGFTDFRDVKIPVSFNCNVKGVTAVAEIAVDGTALKLLIIVPRRRSKQTSFPIQ